MPPQEGASARRVTRSSSSNKEQNFVTETVVSEPTVIDVTQVAIDDKLYDAAKLASIHPGGELFVRSFAGSDASEAFLSYHRRRFPHAKMTDLLVGRTSARKESKQDDDYLELCVLVEQLLPRNESFAPWHYFVKVAAILGSAVSLEVYMHYNIDYRWQYSAALGFIMALIGLNIQHDANHGAVSRHPSVNRFLGLTQNWIGGSAIDWIHQHVVQHHVNCNDVHDDPDMMGGFLLRLNPTKPLLKHQWAQCMYVFVLLSMFGFNVIVQTILHLLRGKHLRDMSRLLLGYRIIESMTWLCFVARWMVLPVYQTGGAGVLLSIAPMYMVAGYYLSFFFVISHNFDGAEVYDHSQGKNANNSFMHKQAASSSNVGGAFLGIINGGLNYQIEHHLFPRVSHCHYPKIAPLVRAFCLKKGVPYVHFQTISENVVSTVKHLYRLGTQPGKLP